MSRCPYTGTPAQAAKLNGASGCSRPHWQRQCSEHQRTTRMHTNVAVVGTRRQPVRRLPPAKERSGKGFSTWAGSSPSTCHRGQRTLRCRIRAASGGSTPAARPKTAATGAESETLAVQGRMSARLNLTMLRFLCWCVRVSYRAGHAQHLDDLMQRLDAGVDMVAKALPHQVIMTAAQLIQLG